MTPLSFALLGLIGMEPRSGYKLRKVFETTPLGNYSSSPGSIYPALKALERAGLVRRTAARDARGTAAYHLTADGAEALDSWLSGPIGDLGEAMLRFSFLPDDAQAILPFLDRFEAEARTQAAALDAFLSGETAQGMSARHVMAVEHGRRGLEASASWAMWARERFEAEGRKEK